MNISPEIGFYLVGIVTIAFFVRILLFTLEEDTEQEH